MPSNADLQKTIDRLRAELAVLEKLPARVAELEKLLDMETSRAVAAEASVEELTSTAKELRVHLDYANEQLKGRPDVDSQIADLKDANVKLVQVLESVRPLLLPPSSAPRSVAGQPVTAPPGGLSLKDLRLP